MNVQVFIEFYDLRIFFNKISGRWSRWVKILFMMLTRNIKIFQVLLLVLCFLGKRNGLSKVTTIVIFNLKYQII